MMISKNKGAFAAGTAFNLTRYHGAASEPTCLRAVHAQAAQKQRSAAQARADRALRVAERAFSAAQARPGDPDLAAKLAAAVADADEARFQVIE